MTNDLARTQSGGQQTTGVALKDQQGMIHVLVIATIEEAELLLAVRGIVGGIDIEQDLSAFPDLFPADLHKPIEQSILQLEEPFPQLETPTYLLGREGKSVKHDESIFSVKSTLRVESMAVLTEEELGQLDTITKKLLAPVQDVVRDGPQNQIESKPATQWAEVDDSSENASRRRLWYEFVV